MAKSSPIDFIKKDVEFINGDFRIEKCRSCDQLMFNVCKVCKCFMPAKVKLAHAECPLGKWGEE